MPASTLKLATSAAALNVLGPQTRIPTIVYREGTTLYLVGGGDPTLVRAKGGNPLAGGSRVAQGACQGRGGAAHCRQGHQAGLRRLGIHRADARSGLAARPSPSAGVVAPVTALVVDGGRVRPGSFSRVANPSRQAADAFAGFLRGQGLTVTSVKSRDAGRRRRPRLARVESPPVGDIVQRMLTESENNFAEALAHLTGGKLLGNPDASPAERRRPRRRWATWASTSPGMSIVDGSGLSTRDQVPAAVLADVLSDVAKASDPDLAAIPPGPGGGRAHRNARRPLHHAADPRGPRCRPREDRNADRSGVARRHGAGRGWTGARVRDHLEQGALAGPRSGDNGPHRQPTGDVRLPMTLDRRGRERSRQMGLAR